MYTFAEEAAHTSVANISYTVHQHSKSPPSKDGAYVTIRLGPNPHSITVHHQHSLGERGKKSLEKNSRRYLLPLQD